eukprot:10091331-Alexandrium_andersonii.AAC.1
MCECGEPRAGEPSSAVCGQRVAATGRNWSTDWAEGGKNPGHSSAMHGARDGTDQRHSAGASGGLPLCCDRMAGARAMGARKCPEGRWRRDS